MEVDIMTSPRLKEHDGLRRHLDGQIPKKELKHLKDSLRTLRMLEPKFLDDSAKDFSDVFHKLVDENIISVGKYGQLILLFQWNHLFALAKYVQTIQDNFPPPTPSSDVPKSFEETGGKTNIHGQESRKPDPDMGPGSGMDVIGHEEIEHGAACHSTHKDLAEPDATDHGACSSGYYGKDRSLDAVDSDEVPEPQQQIIQPARLLSNQGPKDTSCEAEMMQCDAEKEGMRSEFFDAANQPPVTQREIMEASDGVAHMQIDPPETDPIAEPIAAGTRGGIAPPSYGSMYPNPGGAPQKHQRVVPGSSPVTKPPPSEPEPPGQTAPIVQNANITGIGNMGNFFVDGEMTLTSTTTTSFEEYHVPQINAQRQKGKGPAGTSQTFAGEPPKKVPVVVHTVKKETKKMAGPLQGAAKGEPVVQQTCNISGIGNFGNFYCGGNMKMNKTIHTYKKQ